MRRPWVILAVLVVLVTYVFLAVRESRDRESARPEPAPIGVTVDPTERLDPSSLQGGGFDFAAIRWTPATRPQASKTVERIRGKTGLRYAFFVPSSRAGEGTFETLAREYSVDRWLRFDGKPLVYVFGAAKVAADPRFSVIRVDNGPSGRQYWVSNPPNIKYGLITLAPGFVGGGLQVPRTEAVLDQQEQFAETNKDRTKLLLWHSWNVVEDRSALLPSIAGSAYAYDRVKEFNERWKRP
ncbi:MAG TPA: hypothetical protein VIF43_03190 [Patescibacteria group bacterium]|jgi:hypothetical protein